MREPTHCDLSGALGVWVVSPNLVSADLHDGGIGSHQVGVDRRLWPLFSTGRDDSRASFGCLLTFTKVRWPCRATIEG